MTREEFLENYKVNRKNTHSVKWDLLEENFGEKNLIPMWVADIDFKTSKKVLTAIQKQVNLGVFGYTYVPDSYYEAFFSWMEEKHNYRPNREHHRFSSSVVAGLYWFINSFTQPDDAIIILTPVYFPFHSAVVENGRKLVTNDLLYHEGKFKIDFDLFEKTIVKNKVKMFIHCSPHNPISRVWTEEELDKLFSICQKHGVVIVSDEIHQDFVFGNHKHIPAPLVSNYKYKDWIVLINSASKSFNLASLNHSNIIIPNEDLRNKFDAYVNKYVRCHFNALGILATEVAYAEGAEWFDGLKSVIQSNYDYLLNRLGKAIPELEICPMEGTYLAFLDFRKIIDVDHLKTDQVVLNNHPTYKAIKEFVQDKARIAVDYGEWFGENWSGFIRLNLACRPETVKEALDNLITAYQNL